MKRDDFTAQTKRALRDRVGARCSRPECGRMTVSPGLKDAGRADVTGRAAHITGAATGGARFNAELTSAERRAPENGIWLCSDCADLIDKAFGNDFSVPQIRSWKIAAEKKQWEIARLRTQPSRPAWLDQLKSPHYVNVPRLLSIVEDHGVSASTLNSLRNGFPRGRYLLRELQEIAQTLRRASIAAIDVREIREPQNELSEGLTISFRQHVWAKNAENEDIQFIKKYVPEKSPQIFLNVNGYRYIFPFDPAWLTTTTAQNIGGSCTLAGIGIIKSIDHDAKNTIATPLTFGIPSFFDDF